MSETRKIKKNNPILGMDFPDPDVICVDDTFYMISTTMHFMPGAEILRSYDLINWEHLTYVYDRLDSTPGQCLEGVEEIYGKGMWAATLRYHKGTFYVLFVCNDTQKTYLYRSDNIEGPWSKSYVDGFYHDASLLFDSDDRVFIVYGNTDIFLTELNDTLTAPKEGGLHRLIVSDKGCKRLGYEGSHLYKIDGRYYLFLIHSLNERWRRVEACYSCDSIEGEFVGGNVFDDDMGFRESGIAQGGIVEGPAGTWNAVLFQDSGAIGRIPVVVPVTWKEDGADPDVKLPVFGKDGKAESILKKESFRPDYQYLPLVGDDDFKYDPDEMFEKNKQEYGCFGLRSMWQFNHEPNLSLVNVDADEGCLWIKTDKLSGNIYHAQNILTTRMRFPACTAEVTIDASRLNDGDKAGLAAFQGNYAWVGVEKEAGKLYAVMYSFTNKSGDVWNLSDEPGELIEKREIDSSKLLLRLTAIFEGEGIEDTAFCEIDTGAGFETIGKPHKLTFRLDHFTGCRFGLFISSEKKNGGEAGFSNFRYI